MMPMPLSISGPVTIACLVVLGIFVYPALLERGARGIAAIVVATLGLTALYAYFDRATAQAGARFGLALLWALAPVIAAVIAARVRRRS